MKFIVIEGLDGCGGETQTKLLKEYLAKNNISHKAFRSPDYSTDIGKAIKSYLDGKLSLDPESAFTLFASDTLLTSKKIQKTKTNIVIMDRYITSTIAYQSARGLDFKKGIAFAKLMDYVKPDAIIYIDIKPETSMKRKQKEKGKLDYHESNLSYLEEVRRFYEQEAKRRILSKWHAIDGEKSIEQVHEDVLSIVKKFL
ncbi:MAG: dTMP kinase [Candidatus Aenigmarchaeota archaeon CG_4_10_14_0_8_um_filter_37_24]|nr:dTMP kinase [Candidatus Aenigmarchaeota archaeon]OIN86364.1 MAG: dTMP kinase [Candidatus Aenigmarchaeota archaeon CG1_02_38_14]PIW40759.1 MAG: dTMP kinase [Candidatus Aenigmarchaeota archaeon CG15_BIG_FIL_POST_REV_8_21_14_020_37_27]PIX51025.1 MAG: dTMP kinase [Candidatus Aenigmarchaeota archaeon CG_4_8_14_3_um_filter_37_24]PIY35265.1 MAG: dTMP kinase [Candidatus Aenigmarchaeota archaeon CG_4_10_14_3_um_filter_37_21]PIZ33880.1 MAG: dTMP kinase [Candidatus Aenigmarchaeota archaeon CG_4_10_14_